MKKRRSSNRPSTSKVNNFSGKEEKVASSTSSSSTLGIPQQTFYGASSSSSMNSLVGSKRNSLSSVKKTTNSNSNSSKTGSKRMSPMRSPSGTYKKTKNGYYFVPVKEEEMEEETVTIQIDENPQETDSSVESENRRKTFHLGESGFGKRIPKRLEKMIRDNQKNLSLDNATTTTGTNQQVKNPQSRVTRLTRANLITTTEMTKPSQDSSRVNVKVTTFKEINQKKKSGEPSTLKNSTIDSAKDSANQNHHHHEKKKIDESSMPSTSQNNVGAAKVTIQKHHENKKFILSTFSNNNSPKYLVVKMIKPSLPSTSQNATVDSAKVTNQNQENNKKGELLASFENSSNCLAKVDNNQNHHHEKKTDDSSQPSTSHNATTIGAAKVANQNHQESNKKVEPSSTPKNANDDATGVALNQQITVNQKTYGSLRKSIINENNNNSTIASQNDSSSENNTVKNGVNKSSTNDKPNSNQVEGEEDEDIIFMPSKKPKNSTSYDAMMKELDQYLEKKKEKNKEQQAALLNGENSTKSSSVFIINDNNGTTKVKDIQVNEKVSSQPNVVTNQTQKRKIDDLNTDDNDSASTTSKKSASDNATNETNQMEKVSNDFNSDNHSSSDDATKVKEKGDQDQAIIDDDDVEVLKPVNSVENDSGKSQLDQSNVDGNFSSTTTHKCPLCERVIKHVHMMRFDPQIGLQSSIEFPEGSKALEKEFNNQRAEPNKINGSLVDKIPTTTIMKVDTSDDHRSSTCSSVISSSDEQDEPRKKLAYRCDYCSMKFTDKSQRDNHYIRLHRKQYESLREKKSVSDLPNIPTQPESDSLVTKANVEKGGSKDVIPEVVSTFNQDSMDREIVQTKDKAKKNLDSSSTFSKEADRETSFLMKNLDSSSTPKEANQKTSLNLAESDDGLFKNLRKKNDLPVKYRGSSSKSKEANRKTSLNLAESDEEFFNNLRKKNDSPIKNPGSSSKSKEMDRKTSLNQSESDNWLLKDLKKKNDLSMKNPGSSSKSKETDRKTSLNQSESDNWLLKDLKKNPGSSKDLNQVPTSSFSTPTSVNTKPIQPFPESGQGYAPSLEMVHQMLLEYDQMRAKNPTLICRHCKAGFDNRDSFEHHLVSVEKDHHPYHCYFCYSAFSTKDFRATHTRDQHGNGNGFSCRICSNLFMEKNQFQLHMQREHGVTLPKRRSIPLKDGVKYRCPNCHLDFDTTASRVSHLKFCVRFNKKVVPLVIHSDQPKQANNNSPQVNSTSVNTLKARHSSSGGVESNGQLSKNGPKANNHVLHTVDDDDDGIMLIEEIIPPKKAGFKLQ